MGRFVILHLGVMDAPYSGAPGAMPVPDIYARLKAGKPPKRHEVNPASVGDVADILEARYGVMGRFIEKHRDEISNIVTSALLGSLETRAMGGPIENTFAGAQPKIEELFKDFIGQAEIEDMGVPGVPTQAALRGVNTRLAHPYAKGNPRRPSFVRSSLYVDSFAAWVD